MGNYTESSAANALRKVKGITVNSIDCTITVESNVVGNSTWGKIDFLTKYCHYELIKVDSNEATVEASISLHTPIEREKFTKHKVKP